jgi:hypothetical protein
MKKRTTLLLVVVVALSLALASSASADEITGRGTIGAKGAGLAVLRGDGEIEIEAHGVGVVWVKGGERLEASGRGHKWDVPGSDATVFWGWSGTIHTSGNRITVWMTGGVIEFTASGTGKVYLRGRGRYEVNGHEGLWSPGGEVLRLDAERQAQ